MKTYKLFSMFVILALLAAFLQVSSTVQADTLNTTITYDDITLPAGFTTLDMPDTWDMNQGPVVITYSLDLSNAPNVAFNSDWNLMGHIGLFDATKASGARMVGFLADWGLPQFPTYPDNNASLDIDDKFNLQRFPNPGNWDESMYDVNCDTNQVVAAFGSGNNYGIWFDRDGVDQWQDDMWGMVNGGTYNTNGVYNVQLTFQKNSTSIGTVCPLMFPNLANPWVTGGFGVPTGFYVAWKPTGPDIIPAGLSFATDETKMGKMHVVIQGASDGGAIIIRDLTVTGYLNIDLEGPITSNVVATPNPAAINSSLNLAALIDDNSTEGSNIASAEYSLDGGSTWSSMTASDGTFDAVSENVIANFNALGTAGIYNLCVRGTDAAGNVGLPECVMFVVYDPSGGFVTGGGWIDSPAGAMEAVPTLAWNQGFETSTDGWLDANSEWYGLVTQVPSGNNGITSSNGSYHAVFEGDIDSAPFTRFDGYRSIWPGTWTAEINVYLDPAWANGQGFDYSVAASGSDGTHQRDYIFHVTKDTSTGKLYVAGSNNTNFAPRQDLENINHYEVTSAGWYTFQHVFRDQDGALAVDLNLLDSNGNVLFTETRYNAIDLIPEEVGGNRYGWFTFINVNGGIAVDEHQLFVPVSLTGKATFGFVSKYQKGASVPTGNTEFQFKVANLNFKSTNYEWLVVAGDKAQFKGTGTINGAGNYGFMLTATDGSLDTFRIKIWDILTDMVVYDNGSLQALGGGSIVIHK